MSNSIDTALELVDLTAITLGSPDEYGLRACQVITNEIAHQFTDRPEIFAFVLTEMAYELYLLSQNERESWLHELAKAIDNRGIEMVEFVNEVRKKRYHKNKPIIACTVSSSDTETAK